MLHLIDHEALPVPEAEGNFDDPAAVGPARTSLRPIQITQPEGPSFTVDGDVVTWSGPAWPTTRPCPACPRLHEARTLPAAFAVAAVLGVLYGLWLRSTRPDVYQGIGLGAGALTVR